VYLHIYLPLMAPALVAVGTYALLLAWNEYLHQFVLLSSKKNMTVPVGLAQFLDSDEAPWNYMMAMAIVYTLPPVAIGIFSNRRFMDETWTRQKLTNSNVLISVDISGGRCRDFCSV
jgi:multiple sugar transport system permease protein